MKRTMYERLSSYAKPMFWGGALLGLLFALGATAIGDMTPEGKRLRQQNRAAFALFAGPTTVLRGNLLQCGVDNQGNVCVDVFNSPTGGGGFWPSGSVDAYIFNTGLQIAGINSDQAGPWATDTVAAYFFDARGTQQHSAPFNNTPVFDTQNPADAAELAAMGVVIDDPTIYNPVLLGRVSASQQDSWTQYWDGDPNRVANRKHPMGIKVTQRSLAWNYPAGNESMIYFVYDFENVTNTPEFQLPNELQFFAGEDALPNGGWRIDDFYASFSTDMDVSSDATQNYSTAILSFDMGISYHGGFSAPEFVYPPNLFKPPFFIGAPGIVGVKYLRSPINPATGQEVGLTLFSNTQNPSSAGAQFVDPLGDEQLWRYLSGNLVPALGDPPCNVAPTTPNDRPVCFVFQQAADTRFYQASGPFSVDPGQEASIVVAYIVAATVATMPDGSPSGILDNQASANANPPGVPSFHPGFPSARGCDAAGLNCTVTDAVNAVLPIERGSGWFQYTGLPPANDLELSSNKLDQFQVEVVPESLLGKALVAQTIFDNKFLLGFAPEAPPFFLAPANNAVTVLWDKSTTETDGVGDPFFSIASDTASALFNPNYRQFDVEGYRVFRGTTPDNIQQIAQFDYAGTTFTDFLCETALPNEDVGTIIDINGILTDVLGYAAGEICTLVLTAPLVRDIGPDNSIGDQTFNLIFNNGGEGGLAGGGVVRLLTGAATATRLDTALAGQPVLLQDNGIPFVLVDQAVTNNFTYFYSVTAFDINSQSSGPISLESVKTTKATVPRAFAPNLETPFSATFSVTGDDGVALGVDEASVGPDPATGMFSGPQPPTNSTSTLIVPDPALVGILLQQGTLAGVIDSFVPISVATGCPQGSNARGMCWKLYLTFTKPDGSTAATVSAGWHPVEGGFDFGSAATRANSSPVWPLGATSVPWEDEALRRYGIPDGFGQGVAIGISGVFTQSFQNSASEALQNRFQGNNFSGGSRGLYPTGTTAAGSRWFEGADETVIHPGTFVRAGSLPGVDTIWHPISHTDIGDGTIYPASGDMVCWPYTMGFLGRAADVVFTWGGNTIVSARDITHNVDVPFDPNPRSSYGFLNQDANANNVIDWQDFDYLDGINQNTAPGGGLDFFCALGDRGINPPIATLESSPNVQPTSITGDQPEVVGPTGLGFGFYSNGEHYIFELPSPSLPADGTEWTLRTYQGDIISDDATTATPSNYELLNPWTYGSDSRPASISGLQFQLSVEEAGLVSSGKPDLAAIHTVPDPYLANSRYDLAPTEKQLMFVNMPERATLRIYSLTGVLVRNINYNDQSGGGRLVWDMRNRDNQFIASGVYFFVVVTPEGDEHVGKFTVINFAGQN